MTETPIAHGGSQAESGAALIVEWFGVRIGLYAEPQILDYVAKQFDIATSGNPRPTHLDIRELEIHVRTQPDLLDDLIDSGRRDGTRERRSFRNQTYRQIRRDDRLVLLEDVDRPNHAFVGWNGEGWSVVSRGQPSGLIVTRLIRELIREDLLDRGGLMFHGGGSRTADGLGVFLAGASGAGKTSASLRLAHGGGRVLATDRALILPVGNDWWIVGLPTSTRLGIGAVRSFGILGQLSTAEPIRAINPFNQTMAEDSHSSRGKKVSLANEEVRELLGTPFAPASPLDRLLVLEAVPNGAFSRESVDASTGRRLLADHLMDPDGDYPDRWLRPDLVPPSDAHVSQLDRVIADVSVERVTWSPPMHCDRQARHRLTTNSKSHEGQC